MWFGEIITRGAAGVATAVTHGATAFITNDKTLRRLGAMLSILLLDSFVER
jgi:hypothetical protein